MSGKGHTSDTEAVDDGVEPGSVRARGPTPHRAVRSSRRRQKQIDPQEEYFNEIVERFNALDKGPEGMKDLETKLESSYCFDDARIIKQSERGKEREEDEEEKREEKDTHMEDVITRVPLKTKKESETLLHKIVSEHILASKKKSGCWYKAPPRLVEVLVVRYPELLTAHDEPHKRTPLHLAIEDGQDDLVNAMINTCNNHPLALIQVDYEGNNCLHAAIESNLKDKTIMRLIQYANEEILSASNSFGYTPLHLAVEYKTLLEEGQQEVVAALVEKGDCALDQWVVSESHPHGISVLGYYEMTRKDYEEEQRKERRRKDKEKQLRAKKEGKPELGKPHLDEQTIPQLKGSSGGSIIAERKPERPPEQQENPKGGMQKPIGGDSRGPEKSLARRNTLGGVGTAKTKPQAQPLEGKNIEETHRKEAKEQHLETEAEKTAVKIMEDIRLRYLRTRYPHQAATFLYGRNEKGIQTKFDHFEGETNKEVNAKDFDEAFQHFRLGKILSLVHFRNVQVKGAEKVVLKGKQVEFDEQLSKDHERRDLKFLFDWLRYRKDVDRILRVTVEDLDVPHSDFAIEKCLEHFGVESLDWRKIDLCPETICKIGGELRDISLRWSGKNAVLRGWSEQEGLAKCPNLRLINLEYDKKIENDATAEKVRRFDNRLNINRCEKTRITVKENSGPESDWRENPMQSLAVRGGAQNIPQTSHKWLESVDRFAEKIQSVKLPSSRFPGDKDIVVAIIDDGFDIWDKTLRNRIINGYSFDNGHRGEYRHSTGGHGTLMAQMVVRVCPAAKLYLFKVETFPSETQLRIDARSAAQAIQFAADLDVDIISMSWKIGRPTKGSEVEKLFDKALKSAIKKGILMFCSSGDSGNMDYGNSYPGVYDDKIYIIGAATALGKPRDATPNARLLDYILPGHEVHERKPKGVRSDSHTGSSVATALAAGLAATIIHCIRVGAIYNCLKSAEELRNEGINIREKDFMVARRSDQAVSCMNAAFGRFNPPNSHNIQYIEVWRLFDGPIIDISRPWNHFENMEKMRVIARIGQEFVYARVNIAQEGVGARTRNRARLESQCS